MCYPGDPIRVHRVNGVVTKIEGNPDYFLTEGRICGKAHSGIMKLYDPYRVKAPLKRTNPKKGPGEDPRWVEIGWEEAMDLMVEKLKPIQEENPNGLCFTSWNYHNCLFAWAFGLGFGSAHTGLSFTGAGGMCGDGVHTMGEIVHGSFIDHPDLEYCNYLIIAGGGFAESWQMPVPFARMLGERKEKGMKLVVVDPRGTGAAAKADEWLPIRPGTDAALFLAMMQVLVNEVNIYDAEYLKTATNAAYLIADDRYLLRDTESGKPLIWDPVDNQAKTYDDPSIQDFALEGSYDTPAGHGRPAFDIFKEHMRQYTPEWAAEITTIPADRIRRIAAEFGEAAQIGSTITIQGKQYPHRPVCVSGYRGLNNHTNATSTCMAQTTLNMIVGAVRTPGGLQGWAIPSGLLGFPYPDRLPPGRDGIVMPQLYVASFPVPWQFPPEHITLKEFWPVSFGSDHMAFEAQINPEKWMKQETAKVLILNSTNPMMNGQDPRVVAEALSKVPFFVYNTVYVDEAADFADLVLPDTTYLERWCVFNWHPEAEGAMLQQPVVEPLYNTRDNMEVWLELADRLGCLTGVPGWNFWFNAFCGSGREVLDIEKKYTWKEVLDTSLQKTWGKGIDWFREHGIELYPTPPEKKYLIWRDQRMPLYHDWFMEQGDILRRNMEESQIKEKIGLDPSWFCDWYTPLPTWEPAVVLQEDKEYDMYAFSFKTGLGRFGTLPATNPWLMEIAHRDPYLLRVMINTETAKKKGLKDGDWVWVESRVNRVKARIRCTELVQHECLGFPAMFGHKMKHPVAQDQGPHFNSLLPYGLEYTGRNCGAMEGTARVKIYKA
jgi:anaerobic selenocysteine-containing dehydrogenase